MNELRECPFCGATAQVIEEVSGFPDELEYFVLCDNLECENRTSPHSTKIAAIAAWNRRADGWVSVGERLPEDTRYKVVVSTGNCWYLAWYQNGKWNICHTGDDSRIKVVWWQPLPQPPEEQT